MTVKRLVIFILLFALLLTLCGCKKKQSGTENSGEASAEQSEDISEQEQSLEDSEVTVVTPIGDMTEINLGVKVEKPRVDLTEYVRDDKSFEYIHTSGGVLITKYKGNAKKLIVPAEIDGAAVNGIFYNGFEGKAQLEAVYIEDGITSIGAYAFSKCVRLNSIRLPETLERIDSNAFYECISLKTLYIPDSVKNIGSMLFEKAQLDGVRIPTTARVDGSFREQELLTGEVVVPYVSDLWHANTVRSFYRDMPGITKMRISEGFDTIAANAFEGMTGLEVVYIPETVLNFEAMDELFEDCSKLQRIYVVDGSYSAYALLNSPWGDMVYGEEES